MDQSAGLRMFGSDTIKLDRMDGMNFTRWKEKMKFLLTVFKVYYVLDGPPTSVMTKEEERKREQDETLCTDRKFYSSKNHIKSLRICFYYGGNVAKREEPLFNVNGCDILHNDATFV
ncbi:hypothetical protein Tco_1056628 [Tanacetum coccineum]|uniref:Gag-pol polyprotein n=1 Tax=Tanacetum coccineum TaxID=301880 RepID=A0ABQ5H448_9ASTR